MTGTVEDRTGAGNGASAASKSRLEAIGLKKFYGSREVVKNVSLVVRKGEIVGLLGPNGAGPVPA